MTDYAVEKMNNQILEANLKLLDENKVLKEDKEILKKRIDRAIKYIGTFDFDYLDSTYEHNARIVLENILEILKGSDKE